MGWGMHPPMKCISVRYFDIGGVCCLCVFFKQRLAQHCNLLGYELAWTAPPPPPPPHFGDLVLSWLSVLPFK